MPASVILPAINPAKRKLAQGLVLAPFPFNSYGAVLKDLSGYGYDLSYAGTVSSANHAIDTRLGPVFKTGSSSKRYRGTVNEPAQQSGGPWTLMAWVRPNTLAMTNDGYFLTYRNFGSHYPLNLAMVKTSGVVSLIIVGAGDSPTKQVSGTKGMTAGRWTHACGVYVPSSKIEIYFDGILDTTNTTSIPSAAGTWNDIAWNLGGPQSDSYSFDGWMAHVYVWNRALTAGEVRQFYEDPWVLFRHEVRGTIVPPFLPRIASRRKAMNLEVPTKVLTW